MTTIAHTPEARANNVPLTQVVTTCATTLELYGYRHPVIDAGKAVVFFGQSKAYAQPEEFNKFLDCLVERLDRVTN